MARAWRIVKSARVATAFDGEGARLHGGRWNSPGSAVVYTAESQSLAALELLVHLQASHLLMAYCAIPVDFADALVEALDPARLPAGWRKFPAPAALRTLGDRWAAERRSVALRVPSVIVPADSGFLLNPRHPHFSRVRIGTPRPFQFDARLK